MVVFWLLRFQKGMEYPTSVSNGGISLLQFVSVTCRRVLQDNRYSIPKGNLKKTSSSCKTNNFYSYFYTLKNYIL